MPRPSVRRRSALAGFAVAILITAVASLVPAGPAGAAGTTHVVQPGQSIQAALDASRPGDRILVRAGAYHEQLTVRKDGMTVIADGAVLVPPASPVRNLCSGIAGPHTQAGICVRGQHVHLASFVAEHRKVISVGRRVQDVAISGFVVRGFSGPNVALVGTEGAHLFDNRLRNGNAYGALSVGSKRSWIFNNHVSTDGIRFIGICVDDVEAPIVAHNDVSGYGVGLCIQTNGADVAFNQVHGNCVGIFVDPGIRALVEENHVYANNANCGPEFFSGIGIFLSGTQHTQVLDNRIEGHRPTGGFGAALVLVDASPSQTADNNVVRHNGFARNTLDIQVLTSGTGNAIDHNDCTTSDPAGLC
jgi:nitrous oxidase accessory protein NosD